MQKDSKKKKIVIFSAITLILILVLILLWWLFFRKIEVTLDYNNGTKDEIILVQINKTIDKDKIKDKDLGENFIGWFKVIEVKDKKEILDEKKFDFKTKIKKKLKLNAVYKAEVKTITVKFDSRGGTKVDDLTLKAGEELKLPKNPTRNGYQFITWKDKNEVPIGNGALLAEDITLYAYWEELPKPESISLSLSRNIGHADGYNTGKAKATVKNSKGTPKYSSNSPCLLIDAKTGDFSLPRMHGRSEHYQTCINKGTTVTITATLPSGKKASKEFIVEPKLIIYDGNTEVGLGSCLEMHYLKLKSSINVTWNEKINCAEGYTYKATKTATTLESDGVCNKPGVTSIRKVMSFKPVSAGGQTKDVCYYMQIN